MIDMSLSNILSKIDKMCIRDRNKSENNKIANKILMYSGSLESTDLALNKLKELKIDESKYFVEKDSNAFEESLEDVYKRQILSLIKNRLHKIDKLFCAIYFSV